MSAFDVSDAVSVVSALSEAIVTLLQRRTSPAAIVQAIDDIVERAHAIDRDVDLAAQGRVAATPIISSTSSTDGATSNEDPR